MPSPKARLSLLCALLIVRTASSVAHSQHDRTQHACSSGFRVIRVRGGRDHLCQAGGRLGAHDDVESVLLPKRVGGGPSDPHRARHQRGGPRHTSLVHADRGGRPAGVVRGGAGHVVLLVRAAVCHFGDLVLGGGQRLQSGHHSGQLPGAGAARK